ncbi:hypothetical protein HC762_01330 [bacterium]|nr:hypothetical protein [bacterium]
MWLSPLADHDERRRAQADGIADAEPQLLGGRALDRELGDRMTGRGACTIATVRRISKITPQDAR